MSSGRGVLGRRHSGISAAVEINVVSHVREEVGGVESKGSFIWASFYDVVYTFKNVVRKSFQTESTSSPARPPLSPLDFTATSLHHFTATSWSAGIIRTRSSSTTRPRSTSRTTRCFRRVHAHTKGRGGGGGPSTT